jgi:hypothetical protein
MRLGPIRRAWIGLTLAAVVAVAAPAAAWGDGSDNRDDPEITRDPSLSGSAAVGSRLDASEATWTGRDVRVYWRWLRCDDASSLESCAMIRGAESTSYTVTAADLGKRLRVLLWVSRGDDYDYAVSPATAPVAAPPPPPPVVAPPVVTPPLASPPPVVLETPALPAPPAEATPPKRMRPAPLIRVRGWLTLRGARITLLTVRAPRRARISVSCAGEGCPRVAPAQAAKLTRLGTYEAIYRAGARIVIRVTRPGFVGKHTTIRIRRGKPPRRWDRCLYPGTNGPTKCQAG